MDQPQQVVLERAPLRRRETMLDKLPCPVEVTLTEGRYRVFKDGPVVHEPAYP
jgi:hypothetical protein